MTQKHIRDVIKLRRQELGKNQTEMGKLLNLSVSAYGKKELGVSPITVEELQTICKFLNLDFEDLNKNLPMSAKTAPVSSDEYTTVVRKMMHLQDEVTHLRDQLAAQTLRHRTDIIGFFGSCIDQMKAAYPDYKPDWQAIAKAAGLDNADSFLADYGRMKADEGSAYMDSAKSYSPDALISAGIADAISNTSSTPAAPVVDMKNKPRSRK